MFFTVYSILENKGICEKDWLCSNENGISEALLSGLSVVTKEKRKKNERQNSERMQQRKIEDGWNRERDANKVMKEREVFRNQISESQWKSGSLETKGEQRRWGKYCVRVRVCLCVRVNVCLCVCEFTVCHYFMYLDKSSIFLWGGGVSVCVGCFNNQAPSLWGLSKGLSSTDVRLVL